MSEVHLRQAIQAIPLFHGVHHSTPARTPESILHARPQASARAWRTATKIGYGYVPVNTLSIEHSFTNGRSSYSGGIRSCGQEGCPGCRIDDQNVDGETHTVEETQQGEQAYRTHAWQYLR